MGSDGILTVGELLDFINKHNIPRDAKVLYQRIHDYYFEEGGWPTINKESHAYYSAKRINDKIDSGEFNDKDHYPNINDPEFFRSSEEELEILKDKYIQAFAPVKYKDDNNLYIDAHY